MPKRLPPTHPSKSRILRGFAVWVGAASVLASFITLFQFIDSSRETAMLSTEVERRRMLAELERQQQRAEVEAVRARRANDEARKQLQQLEIQLAAVRSGTGKPVTDKKAAELASEIAALRNGLSDLSARLRELDQRLNPLVVRLNGIESAIMTDPQKAVAVPLLRRDFEGLQQQTTRDLETIRSENVRLYDLMKMLIGLMGLVSFGLLGTAVGNVFKREPRDTSAKDIQQKLEVSDTATANTA